MTNGEDLELALRLAMGACTRLRAAAAKKQLGEEGLGAEGAELGEGAEGAECMVRLMVTTDAAQIIIERMLEAAFKDTVAPEAEAKTLEQMAELAQILAASDPLFAYILAVRTAGLQEDAKKNESNEALQ